MTAGVTPEPDRLVVRTDRRLVGRLVWRGNVPLILVMVATVAVAGAAGAMLTGTTGLSGVPLVGFLVGVVIGMLAFMAGYITFLAASVMHMVHREVDVMAVVEPTGMHLAVPGTDVGSVYLPWDAIASVQPRGRGRGARLVVRVVPGLERHHPGARGLEDDVLWRALRARGLTVRTGTALVPHEQVVAAVQHFRSPGVARRV